MDWQTPEDAVPSAFVTESNRRALSAAPPASGAWRAGDDPGDRRFVPIGDLTLERGADPSRRDDRLRDLGRAQRRRQQRDAGAARPHRRQPRGRPGEAGPSDGRLVVGTGRPGQAARPRRLVRRRPEHARRLPGLDRPGIARPGRRRVGLALPVPHASATRSTAQRAFSDAIGVTRWAAVVGGSMGGMQALEWAVGEPERVERVAVLAAPPAVERRPDRAQLGAERGDPVRSRRSPAATTTTPPTAPARTAASPSPAAWRC